MRAVLVLVIMLMGSAIRKSGGDMETARKRDRGSGPVWESGRDQDTPGG